MASPFFTTSSSLVQKDLASIWHPFTQMQMARPPIPLIKGTNTLLFSEDGRIFLDGISSWWVNLHGHAHPYIVDKIKTQAELLEHAIFADFTHPPAIELATRLLPILPGHLSKIFYSDNGSTAVEVAIKIALQYWHNQNIREKIEVISFKHSYHGDTFGAMSAAGRNAFNQPFWNHLFHIESIDPPLEGFEQESLIQLETILQRGKAACFIFEPLILGTGGMLIYSKIGLNALLERCKKYQVLTIADEVMTGFGRVGTLFACEQLQEKPDILCLSKGLTGGFLPLGVTACQQHIFEAFLSDHLQQAFLHGHSYTANPLACVSALASLDLLQQEACSIQRKRIAVSHKTFCQQWSHHPNLKRCEAIGTILVLEYHTSSTTSSYFQPSRDRLYSFFLDHGILLRPLGNVLYVLPPYCIQADELQFIYDHLILTLESS
jgi:adenosylmethionine-8-amino-7-oxononanoate aminotransferase